MTYSTMLVDLESLDIDVGHNYRYSTENNKSTDRSLRFESATESFPCDHKGACITGEDKNRDYIAIDTMEHQEFSANNWNELPAHEETEWNTACEMESDTNAVVSSSIIVPKLMLA